MFLCRIALLIFPLGFGGGKPLDLGGNRGRDLVLPVCSEVVRIFFLVLVLFGGNNRD